MSLIWACSPFIEPDDLDDEACACDWDATDPVEDWIDMASDILYYLSDGYVTGVCRQVVRPVTSAPDCLPPTIGPWAACCDDGPKLMLRGPNAVVYAVKIDGVTLDPSEYAIVDGEWLIRRTGSWPTRNDIRQPDTEDGTWSIDVGWGLPADLVTKAAAIEMTCEMARSALGGTTMFAPGVVTANVQGATATIEDVAEAVAEGRELMPATARFLSMYGGRGDNATVWSPEIDTYRLVTVTFPT